VIERVERLASLADVVKASDEDLAALWPDRSLSESLWALTELGASCAIATRGAEGARFVAGGTEGVAPAVAATVADTIAAGDTFGAGLLDALWSLDLLGADRREDLRALSAEGWQAPLAWAARCAAVTVSRPGADPPRRAELPA
jgi:fructokinase